ncbi:protein adenylyltransferase SelO [Chitiniphilus eburneus]|uniref:Protein nucleotidyltransferase YdiU n=1 Tax=Chitiniphilus eburneus TaxID=2571148 RepID=A0A4U0Q0P5_9NEIS|nr:YdiU family protein [Chitiniphilus eburneus]TJZ73522.1 YdiU family protein [Chitiniphilus eburneus]
MKHTFPDLPLAPRFAALPDRFHSRVQSTPLPQPSLIAWNEALATELRLDSAAGKLGWVDFLAGNSSLTGYPQIASVYSGHQFGVWAGQLGDGRAMLVAEIDTPAGIRELQLKGAGQTPYSRRADGRAVLRSSIREYLCSEAMHALGIPTTRALALVGSPQPVWRETVETAAVVTRVAPSFLRFGHFEHFHHRDQQDAVRELADWTIAQFYPECAATAQPYLALLHAVVERTARLIAAWQAVGFCHGVMNTDNMSLLGLTLDYGPFGFMDGFDAGYVCNHSDDRGRYSYEQQPQIGLWNLHCLAQTLLPEIGRDAAVEALQRYQTIFEDHFGDLLRQKLGLRQWREEDWGLAGDLMALLQAAHTDWTIFWRRLAMLPAQGAIPAELRDMLLDRDAFDTWVAAYRARLGEDGSLGDTERATRMNAVNPKYVLRNHLAEEVIRAAQQGDHDPLHRLAAALAHPYDDTPEYDEFAALPPDWARTLSVSCSS